MESLAGQENAGVDHAVLATAGRRANRIALLIAGLGPTAAALLYMHGLQSADQVRWVYFGSKALLFAFPAAWWLWYEQRRYEPKRHPNGATSDGPAPSPARSAATHARRHSGPWLDLCWGAATGLLIAAVIYAAYRLLFSTQIDTATLQARVEAFGAREHFLAYAAFLAVVNSGLEEYYWRWFVFGRLRREISVPTAAVLSALAFSAHHFVVLQHLLDDTLLAAVFSAGICAGGVIWAWQYHRTRSLPGVWLSHLLVDIAALGIGHELLSA